MKLIACVWGGTPWSRPFDLMDEHYYTDPSTMASYATKYDGYNRSGPKVFVGEYAVTSGHGVYGNLAAALGEAAFMTGIERNSDIVELACYAPLFANVNGMQWHPNLINFDNTRSFGTPAYYVQQMFSQNRGDTVLPTGVSAPSGTVTITNQNIGAVGLGTWSTAASYTNLLVSSNGVTLYQSDFISSGTNGWNVFKGAWITNAGEYRQTDSGATDCRTWTGSTNWGRYTYSLRARKDSGSEGFLIIFNWRDSNNYMWWNIGGWGNTKHAIEYWQNGSKTTLPSVAGSVTTGVWYDIRIELSSSNILCYLDNTLIQSVAVPTTTMTTTFHASTTHDRSTGEVIIKAVNRFPEAVAATVNLAGVRGVATNATLIQMSSGSLLDENTLDAPANISPVTSEISVAGTNFTVTLPAYSLSVLKLAVSGIVNPAQATLVHRYSFSEVNGTNVADSIGGPAWGGWLPNGGTWLGGQLALKTNATKSLSQYLELPAGILSNYTAVTIDAWASFGILPNACFFYGFGDISGSTGYDYIFCQPKNGRIAITDGNYSAEQNANGNFDCTGRTNLHLTAVFNPPAGTIAIYTNGVLAGINRGVTISMSSVSNLYSYIGRSLYSGDSYFDFTLDEFRIYNGALTPNDIAATQVLGPDLLLSTVSPVMSVSVSGGSLTLSWPVASSGYTVYTTTNLADGNWSAVATVPQIVGDHWEASLPVAASERFYRLEY